MEFRILGPLEVVAGDRPVKVPGAKPRALLAILLVHANRAVSRDRLIEDVWEGSPPGSPDATLQTYVYQLRRALRVDALQTYGDGYRLEVEDGALDALRFERVVQELSQAPDASPRERSLRLHEALSWWRGPALADFADAAWAQPEAARLEELRLGAVEELTDVRLELGEHALLVPELEAAVAEHPLRERLWRQLILALYRCNRQADALAAYQRVRTLLADELGLDPSPELSGLERAILDHDAALMPASTGSATAAPETRREATTPLTRGAGVPRPPTSFVGRDAEVAAVGALLDDHWLVTLKGPGGCGKTRLAIEVAHRLGDGFPDGVHFADLAAVSDGDQVGDAVVAALGLAQDPARADTATRLAKFLGERAVLCVLDNCEHVLDACAALAEAVVAVGGSSRLLATSRQPLGVLGEQVYTVPSLDVDTEAVRLFAERAGEARAGFVVNDSNRPPVVEICHRLDGIPLAIELASARISHLAPTQLLARLADRFGLLTAERRVPRHQTLTATLDWSYELLDDEERRALRCLAVFPASFSLEAAEAVVGTDSFEVLASLVGKSLVHIVDSGEDLRYRLLETVRLYAWNRCITSEADAVRTRHRDWTLDRIESIPREERMLADVDPLHGEYPNIRSALSWSHSRGDHEAMHRIAGGVDWRQSEYWREGARWLQLAAAEGEDVGPDLKVPTYVMLTRLGQLTAHDPEDWVAVAGWTQRAIDAAVQGEPSPVHAEALGVRAIVTAIEAVQRTNESLAERATHLAEAGVEMSQRFAVPWRRDSRFLAGSAYAILSLSWPDYADTAHEHFSSGVAVGPPGPPFLGLHALLRTHLAVHRVLAGDIQGACALAREAQDDVAFTPYGRTAAPLTLALILALDSPGDVSALQDALGTFHEAAKRLDWGPGAQETVILFGGFLAALREDWELASRLLAAGERGIYGSVLTALMLRYFQQRVRGALGSELARRTRAEGRAMPTADALAAALMHVSGSV